MIKRKTLKIINIIPTFNCLYPKMVCVKLGSNINIDPAIQDKICKSRQTLV